MRARGIKPGLFKNELLGSADPLLTILFEGLWCCADREGRLEDRPLRICAEVFPYRRQVTERRCDQLLQWLHDEKFIHRYAVEGRRYIQVLSFWKHQKPHSKERPSEIPPLSVAQHQPTSGANSSKVNPEPEKGRVEHALTPDSGLLTPDSGLLTPDSPVPGKGRDGNGNGSVHLDQDQQRTIFERIQARYPQGLHRGDHWLKAERAVYRLLEQGVTEAELLLSVDGYSAQQLALQNTGTERVMRPNNFFEGAAWRGPFPAPKTVVPRRGRKTFDDYKAEREQREAGGAE